MWFRFVRFLHRSYFLSVLEKFCTMSQPKLVVFDLDYTLWPFWTYTHIGGPITRDKDNNIVSNAGEKLKPYPEVPEILEQLKNDGFILGLASRTDWPEGAFQLLEFLDWNKYFTYREIYPGEKTTHFEKMHKASGVDYSDMLFFDDEMRNINDLQAFGVKSILVKDGVNKKLIEESLNAFKQK